MSAKGKITSFANAQTITGRRFELEWARLFDRLCHAREARSKLELPLWSPAIWPGDRRPEGSIPIEVSALVLDLDHGATLSGGFGALEGGPMGCLHTSWQHQRDVEIKVTVDGVKVKRTVREDRFRLVFPFAVPVAAARYPVVWRSAERWMRDAHGLTIDGQVKNPGRSWFVPAYASGFVFEARRNEGPLLDPWELVDRWPTLQKAPDPPSTQWRPPPRSSSEQGGAELQRKRASAYLRKMPESIAGQDGHKCLWNAALALVKGFNLSPDVALDVLLQEFNPRCDPPWSERELSHKVRSASNATTGAGFVRNRDRKVGSK